MKDIGDISLAEFSSAIVERDELREALTRIIRGSQAVLLDAALCDEPVNPDVLQQIVTDASAALMKSDTYRSAVALTESNSQ